MEEKVDYCPLNLRGGGQSLGDMSPKKFLTVLKPSLRKREEVEEAEYPRLNVHC